MFFVISSNVFSFPFTEEILFCLAKIQYQIKEFLESIFQNVETISESTYIYENERLIYRIPVQNPSKKDRKCVWKVVFSKSKKSKKSSVTSQNSGLLDLVTAFMTRNKNKSKKIVKQQNLIVEHELETQPE